MIEIRTDEQAPPARPDGPHSHEQTRAIAEALSEAARLLNYATMPGNGGLRYPSDVYDVLGALAGMAHTLPQALGQMANWTATETRAGRVREHPSYGDHGGDAHAAATALAGAMAEAAELADRLGTVLGRGQAAVRGLESIHGDEE